MRAALRVVLWSSVAIGWACTEPVDPLSSPAAEDTSALADLPGPSDDAADSESPEDVAKDEVADAASPSCPPPPVEAGQVRARALGCAGDLPEGPLAAGRVGDLVLENAVARFVVRTGPHGHAVMGLLGGGLVDAVRVRDGAQLGPDQLREWVMTAGFQLISPDVVEVASAGDSGEARVRVAGGLSPFPTIQAALPFIAPEVRAELVYQLLPDSPTLELQLWLWPLGSDPVPGVLAADLTFFGGDLDTFVPGLGAHDLPESTLAPTVGYAPSHPGVTAGAYASGSVDERQLLNLGPIRGALHPAVTVEPGGTLVSRYLSVASSPDLSAAMAAVASHLGEPTRAVSGSLVGAEAGDVVFALDAAGQPLTWCLPGPDGAFACDVPAAATALAGGWIGSGPAERGGAGQLGEPTAIDDSPALVPEAPYARLTLAAHSGPTQVAFRANLSAPGLSRRDVVSDGATPLTVRLPPGEWTVTVGHGPFWTRHQETVVLQPKAKVDVDAGLAAVVDATKYASADLHAHSELSPDSDVPVARRLREMAAEDLDLLVMTEHDFVADADAWADRLLLPPERILVAGVEVSTMHLGHFNTWPATADSVAAGEGAPVWFGWTWPQLFSGLDGAVQCNHPRFSSGYAAFFSELPLSPATPVGDVGCQLLEVLNGFAAEDNPQVLADWLNLLAAGARIGPTGTSDAHKERDPIGHPRTLIRLGPKGRTKEALLADLLLGRVIATAGPLLELEVSRSGAVYGPGDVVPAGAALTASVTISAPAWMNLGTLVVYGGLVPLLTTAVDGVEADSAGLKRVTFPIDLSSGLPAFLVAVHRDAPPSPPSTHAPAWAVTGAVWLTQ